MSLGNVARSGSLGRMMHWHGTFALAAVAGGEFFELAELGVTVYGALGLGLPPLRPILAAGAHQTTVLDMRTIGLLCASEYPASTVAQLYDLVGPDRVGVHDARIPAQLRYTFSDTTWEIGVVLVGSPEADRDGGVVLLLRTAEVAWRLVGAPISTVVPLLNIQPLGQQACLLLRSAAGVWSVAAAPQGDCTALHYGAQSGALYAAADGAVWRYAGGVWVQLGAVLGGVVRALLEGPDGTLYVAGSFAGGVVRWDGSAWQVLAGVSGAGLALAIGSDGLLYASTSMSGYVYLWTGSAWLPAGSGLASQPRLLLVGPDTQLYAAGDGLVARLYSGVWMPLRGVVAGWDVYAALFQPDGRLVVGGDLPGFAQVWNGAGWVSLNVSNTVYALAYTARGLHLFGDFQMAGGLALWSGCAIARGGTFYSFDVQLDMSRSFVVAAAAADGSMAVGLGGAGDSSTVYIAGHAALDVLGSATTWPTLTCTYSGSGSGGVIYYLVNLTNGDALHFDGLLVLPGEVITIDCETVAVRSSYRGDLSATVRAGSRALRLLPGVENQLLFNGDRLIEATLSYVPRYLLVDNA